MKNERYLVDFGDDSWTIVAGSQNSAAIIAIAERLKNGRNIDLKSVTDSKGNVYNFHKMELVWN